MNVKRNLIIALAVASLGIVGSAQARGGDDGDGHRRDGHRVVQQDVCIQYVCFLDNRFQGCGFFYTQRRT